MPEKNVVIRFHNGALEARLNEAPGDRAALVSHPHPLYGGDMYNSVVSAIVDAYREANYTTLRFNFRGIGRNQTSYDQAEGGKADVRAALDYLRDLGKTAIDLAGYSFGSWINTIGLDGYNHANRLTLVSPPVAFLDFSALLPDEKIQLVITGSNDELAPPAELKRLVSRWNPNARLVIIQGADHFYFNETQKVREAVCDFLRADEAG
ncbi:MAG: alpha/beta hydrolase [Deltaproteobacteria bacterium]|nr:alpha/beta hydrolase [Deltaproteobacteria bacterium]